MLFLFMYQQHGNNVDCGDGYRNKCNDMPTIHCTCSLLLIEENDDETKMHPNLCIRTRMLLAAHTPGLTKKTGILIPALPENRAKPPKDPTQSPFVETVGLTNRGMEQPLKKLEQEQPVESPQGSSTTGTIDMAEVWNNSQHQRTHNSEIMSFDDI